MPRSRVAGPLAHRLLSHMQLGHRSSQNLESASQNLTLSLQRLMASMQQVCHPHHSPSHKSLLKIADGLTLPRRNSKLQPSRRNS